MNLFLLLAGALTFTLLLGRLIEKIRVPWVFAALFLGLILSVWNPTGTIMTSETFNFLANLGMYFLLFMIGLELDVAQMFRQGKFIFGLSTAFVVAESLLGTLFMHAFFDITWGIAILASASFATVGEAILIPILDEFKITKTQFGQTILGVGTLDDIFELATIIAASVILGSSAGHSDISIAKNVLVLGILFITPLFLHFLESKKRQLNFKQIPPLFLFGLIALCAFVGVGDFVEAGALGAIFAGIALKNFLSAKSLAVFESSVRTVAYGFFVPIFFLQVGSSVNLSYLLSAPILILAVLAITSLTKIGISWLAARKTLGLRKTILLGISLSAKFSTSIVILSMLFNRGLIDSELYSVLIGAMIVSQFVIPVTFSVLLKKWNLKFYRAKKITVKSAG
ncbi:MAG: cation:proton antiporter [Patescibacteria group bacterium]